MHGRDHARTREESHRRRPDAPPVRSETDRLLALQRSAGNHAVGALLARSPDGAPAKENEETSGAKATLPGIGTIPLISVSFGAGRPLTRGRDDEEKQPPDQEIVFSSKPGKHSAKLQRAALDGRPMTVEVTLGKGPTAIRIKLEGAIVSGYSTSGDGPDAIESWSLNFTAIEQHVEREENQQGEENY